jgi:RNA polymerase sigma-70 factor (ECF subfamily)
MLWRQKPTRETRDSAADGEAESFLPSRPSGLKFALAGPGKPRIPGAAFSSISAQSGGDVPGAGRGEGDAEKPATDENRRKNTHSGNANSGPENSRQPQPSGVDGVPEDMATLVLDNPALGANTVLRPGAVPDMPRGVNYAQDESSDAAFMLRVAAGDEAAFNYLVGKYHRAMNNFLYRMVHSQAVAEELAQEVFLRVYRSRESYRAEAKFTTWLYRIATNLAVNHARDTRHERSAQNVYLDAPDEDTGTTPDVADDEQTVEQRMMREERMAAIRSHVMALPERQRMAVLMHKYQGMDYRQIGDVLKLSESATKSLLFRAYQTLRDKLKDFV